MGHDRARWGSVTFVQRFGSSLNLNPHVHVLMLDGVYVDGEDAPVSVPAPPLSDQAVQQIVETSARRIIRWCTKRGLLDDTAADPLTDEEPVLAALTAASVRGITATGARAGQRPAPGPERCGHRGAYAPSPTLPRGPGAPGPGPRAHRGGQAGCRAVGGGRRCERCVLRPSTALGDPAGAGVFLRPQRMQSLWRAPEDHRRPDRSGLDPMLFDRGRFAGPAPGVGPLPGPPPQPPFEFAA